MTRNVFVVLSPRSLPYAAIGLRTLMKNSADPLRLTLLTDSEDDRKLLEDHIAQLPCERGSSVAVFGKKAADERAAVQFSELAYLRMFREGHPCWRKITDPLLFAERGEEVVILDPDLIFPNRFRFEPTPAKGVLLMWQNPNCLLPSEVVLKGMNLGIRFARHVDIGVGQLRAGFDLDWLDWVIGRLGGASLPRMMHVEAIVWSALLMHLGGGHLDPRAWHCWARTQYKRTLLKLGRSRTSILRMDNLANVKCFHAGGEAKWWLEDKGLEEWRAPGKSLLLDTQVRAIAELEKTSLENELRLKRLISALGYYRYFDRRPA